MARRSARRVALTGMLFALAVALGFAESLLPPLPLLPPGVKLGLSNVVVMFCLLRMGRREAVLLLVLKALFAALTRGPTAGLLSFCGGALSILVMGLLLRTRRMGEAGVSVGGAVAHNLGQLVAAAALLQNLLVFSYTPLMVLSGIVMGLLTALVLKATLPLIDKIFSRR